MGVRAEDLDLRELLEFEPGGGVLLFGGRRAVLLDTVALGLLRKELVETLGSSAARGILTRFGYAHGWRTAASLREDFPWESEREWRVAGGRLHRLMGLVLFEPIEGTGEDAPFAEGLWCESYEAEQHLLHLGRAREPVCWSLAGFASGYLSRCTGREIYCVEERCAAAGDATCRMVGRSREDWGEAIEPHLAFYEADCLEGALAALTGELAETERRLRDRRVELDRLGLETDPGIPAGIVARSAAMRRVVEVATRAAAVESTVLVTGESGVGKERIARLIHEESARAAGPFVAVNAGALPEALLESELFGHVRGAFTGADRDRPGLFEAARGGTLFLDEIGEMPRSAQVRLLRVLEERAVRPVGGTVDRPVDVRVVAATNRDLEEAVRQGDVREDLLFRLRVVEIEIPPLRERPDDVGPLARTILAATATPEGRVTGFTPAALDRLRRHPWPGNVRELANAIEHGRVFATGTRIDVAHLPRQVRTSVELPASREGVRPLEEVEREYVLRALEAHGGHRGRTAARLGIGTATLYRKLRRWSEADAGAQESSATTS